MSDTLFDQDDNTDELDSNDIYTELVGEGRKYKDQEALARSVLEKEIHIRRLETEAANTRRELEARRRMEETLDQIASNLNKPSTGSERIPNGRESDEDSTSPELIEQLLEKKLSERSLKERREANLSKTKQTLVERYGNRYPQELKRLANELGVDQSFLDNLAADKPNVLLQLLQDKPKEPPLNPPRSSNISISSGNYSPPSGKRTDAYYRDLKKRDPALYNSPAIQLQRHNDAIQLGQQFFD